MKRCEVSLLRLNKLFKWSNNGFLFEGVKCSNNDMNNGLRKVGRDNRCRFKPGIIIDESDSDSDATNNGNDKIEDDDNSMKNNKEEEEEEEYDNNDNDNEDNDNESNDNEDDDADDEEEEEEEESNTGDDESENVKPPPSYPCPVCATRFVLMSQLCTHMNVNHTQNPSNQPSSTESIIPNNACETIKQHSYNVKHVVPQTSSCSICDQKFTNSYNMVRHMRSQHSSKKFKCPNCDRIFSRLDTMKLHMFVCKKKSPI
jgi:hypothetical protein